MWILVLFFVAIALIFYISYRGDGVPDKLRGPSFRGHVGPELAAALEKFRRADQKNKSELLTEAIWRAITEPNPEATVWLLRQPGANSNASFSDPLICCAAKRFSNRTDREAKIANLRILLEHGADPNRAEENCPNGYFPESALGHVASSGGADAAECLLSFNADPNWQPKDVAVVPPLVIAVEKGHLDVVKLLLAAKADPNVADHYSGKVPLGVAAEVGNLGIVKVLLENGADPSKRMEIRDVRGGSQLGWTPLMIAACEGHLDVVGVLLEARAQVNDRNANGLFPLGSAIFYGHSNVVALLLKHGADPLLDPQQTVFMAEQKGHRDILAMLNGAIAARKTGNKPAAQIQRPNENAVFTTVQKSLFGLVGLDGYAKRFALDVADFLVGAESVARLICGEAGTGKTEFAQRLCGSRDGYPGFSTLGVPAYYISGVDGRFEIRKLVDDAAPHSIIFIDEADKCLDPGASMVSPADATQLHHAIVTHFGRKPIYWAFLGTFTAMRRTTGGQVNLQSLEKTVGRELASRLDFADWSFPDWTLETLLQAVRSFAERRGLGYDDEALLILVQHCLRTGGAVRAFDNIDKALHRQFRLLPADGKKVEHRVSVSIAREYLGRLTKQAA